MTDTPHLGLPVIEAAQAQKHVTHNEALTILDALVMLAVLDRDLSAPPASPAVGDRYLVKSPGTGGFAGKSNQIAHYDGAWFFYPPRIGWTCYVQDEAALLAWNGTAWQPALQVFGGGVAQNLSLLGLGTTADGTNPFSAKLNNALWTAKTVAEGGDGHLRYKMSKESAGKTLSLLLQDNYSARAEIGLTGDDDFHVKVSADGTNWFEGLKIDRNSGRVSFPVSGGPREVLTASRTYYVRADGSDGNNGLTNSAGGAFATIQKAIDTAAGLDLGIFDVTLQVGAGTYTGANILKTLMGAGTCIIVGDETTPANAVVSTTSASCFTGARIAGNYALRGMRLKTTTSGSGISLLGAGLFVTFQKIDFNGCVDNGIFSQYGASVTATGAFEISGNCGRAFNTLQGHIRLADQTLTLTGTPAWGVEGLLASRCGVIEISGMTFVGPATGKRYTVRGNAHVFTAGGGANYWPGNVAGTTTPDEEYA